MSESFFKIQFINSFYIIISQNCTASHNSSSKIVDLKEFFLVELKSDP